MVGGKPKFKVGDFVLVAERENPLGATKYEFLDDCNKDTIQQR